MGGSHLAVAKGWQRNSAHEVAIEGLPARFWKWRMRGAAFEFAKRVRDKGLETDLWFAIGLMDLAHFKALVTGHIPTVLYMHECQAAYPWKGGGGPEERDLQFLVTDLASAAAADRVVFNSSYLRDAFYRETAEFIRRMPDIRPLWLLDEVMENSTVVGIGVELSDVAESVVPQTRDAKPKLLWCHRWEHDKNPEEFFRAVFNLADLGVEFELIVAGHEYERAPSVFTEARERLGDRIIHWGGVSDRKLYIELLAQADVVVSCALHETFGVAMIEAAYAGAHPLAPRRLSYPEIFPQNLHGRCLYADREELELKLEGVLTGHLERATGEELRAAFGRYGWPEAIGAFDALVAEVLEKGGV